MTRAVLETDERGCLKGIIVIIIPKAFLFTRVAVLFPLFGGGLRSMHLCVYICLSQNPRGQQAMIVMPNFYSTIYL